MIVLGADTHKRSHTIAAVAAASGELRGEQTVQVGRRGFDGLLRWARSLEVERVWALEDCRHVSGSLERFLIERGGRVLRIRTHLTATVCSPSSSPVGAATAATVCERLWVSAPSTIIALVLLHRQRRTPGGHGLLEAVPRIYQVTPDIPDRRRATNTRKSGPRPADSLKESQPAAGRDPLPHVGRQRQKE